MGLVQADGPATFRRRGMARPLVLALLTAGLLLPPAPAVAAGSTARVSVSSDGRQGSGGGIPVPSISADGNVVAFSTAARNLVDGDTNDAEDVFVHDRRSRVTTRVSVGPAGAQGNGLSNQPSISGDGNVVAFRSNATNLVSGDTNAQPDVFVHDRRTGETARVSVATAGTQAGGASTNPSISGDGNVVAFRSAANNLVSGDTNAQPDVFVRDRQAGTTTRVSVVSGGLQATGGLSESPSISTDGNVVAFMSRSPNVVPGDTNVCAGFGTTPGSCPDIFVHDRRTATTTRVSMATGGAQANDASLTPSLNADGNLVAFNSRANNLVTQCPPPPPSTTCDRNAQPDVFVHDRRTAVTTRESVAGDGSEGDGGSFLPSINADGRFVAFESQAPNLVAGDTNGLNDIFVRDRQAATTTRVSVSLRGFEANGGSFLPSINADGRFVAFSSEAPNLVPGDTNGAPDAFVHDRTPPDPLARGYWLGASDGGVFPFGDARFLGSMGHVALNSPITGISATPTGNGYWLVATDGGIFAFGDADFAGSMGARRLNQPVVAMAPTPSGNGYWLVASDGGIFAFGDAGFFGSTGAMRLNRPVVGMAPTPSGNGYWLVASDGGIFAFGDAGFFGSSGAMRLNRPVVGMASTPPGNGYWLVASDGGIFAFGNAPFLGSTGGMRLNQRISGMAPTPSGGGYWLVGADGGIFAFGNAPFLGSTGGLSLNQPVVGMAAS